MLPVTAIQMLTDAALRVPAGLRVDTPILNHFTKGLYTRSIFVPKGTLLVGKIHKRETLNICAMGDISILTAKGVARFRAGDIVNSDPGIQKVGYAHEDTVWVNVHPTHERDLAIIEEEFVADPTCFNAAEFMQKVREAECLGYM